MNVDTQDTPLEVYLFVFNHGVVTESLSPVGHETDSNQYRVPVHIKNELHTVYVGENHKRMFDADSLPDFMKHRLAILAVSHHPYMVEDHELSMVDLFSTSLSDPHSSIGWRASPSMYIVVMTLDELKSLGG
jgi:hypothetical protein